MIADKLFSVFNTKANTLIGKIVITIAYFITIIRNLSEVKTSHIIYFRHGLNALLLSPFLNKFIKSRYVIEVNGILSMEEEIKRALGKIPLFSVLTKLIYILEYYTFKNADMIVTVTHQLKKTIIKIDPKTFTNKLILVTPNGVNTNLFKPLDRNVARKVLRLPIDAIIIGFVGNYAPWHDFDTLFHIAQAFDKAKNRILIVIVGNGRIREYINNLVHKYGIKPKSLLLVGKVDHRLVPYYINAFDICIAPLNLLKRNIILGVLPLKILEYAACGKPIITCNLPDVLFIVKKYFYGEVVQCENVNEYVKAINELIKKINRLRGLQKKIRKNVLAEFTWYKFSVRIIISILRLLITKQTQTYNDVRYI